MRASFGGRRLVGNLCALYRTEGEGRRKWGDFELFDAGPGDNDEPAFRLDGELVGLHEFLHGFKHSGRRIAYLSREGEFELRAVVVVNNHSSVFIHKFVGLVIWSFGYIGCLPAFWGTSQLWAADCARDGYIC